MALVDEAELLVSEVVTVATLHSGSDEANVAVSTENGCVRIEVTDAHRGFALEPEDAALGLRIVDRVAPRWGVDLTKPGKTVWFELELPIALDAA
jgi:anti-sigma regulatory factor (Ser/Thr protein kinase)